MKGCIEMREKLLQKKVIIIVLLFFFSLISVTYAIFKDSILGSSSVTLATWDVTLNQANVNNSLFVISEPHEVIANYTLNVTSVSEVSIVYSIILDNLPSGVSVSLDGVNYVAENNHKVVFTNGTFTIPYNDSTKTRQHLLYFKASTTAEYVNNIEVNVSVDAKQMV